MADEGFIGATAMQTAALVFSFCHVEVEDHGHIAAVELGMSEYITFHFDSGSTINLHENTKMRIR